MKVYSVLDTYSGEAMWLERKNSGRSWVAIRADSLRLASLCVVMV